MSSENPLRLEIKIQQPNPVFEKWLEKWLEQAVQRNVKSQYKLKEALESLRSYPLPLASGRECAILRGFGSALCQMIDEEIKVQATKGDESVSKEISFQQDVQEVGIQNSI